MPLLSFFKAAEPDMSNYILTEGKDAAPPSTKLVCTIGPVSNDVETLCQLLDAGMQLARFDFSHGDAASHQVGYDNLQVASKRSRKLCATVMDTLGPEILVLNRSLEPIALSAGQTVTLTCNESARASSTVLPISYPSLAGSGLQAGMSIFVGQYLFTGSETTSAYLTVQSVAEDGSAVTCIVANSCVLEGVQLTVHFGAMSNAAPVLSQQDKRALAAFGRRNHVDFVALSFTRSAADVAEARAYLDSIGMGYAKIIAKIENKEGLVNYREVMEAADAVILSRGSMGNCLDPEKMFVAQKMLLSECNYAGKPIFVTRVVDTMTDAPRPTRAEATDVANLVLDGADGIILASETFRGKFPIAAAETVLAIAAQAEHCYDSYRYYQFVTERMGLNTLSARMTDKTEALAMAAVRAASKLRAAVIVVFTVTGRTAGLIAKYRPQQPILTVVVPAVTSSGLRWHCSGDSAARQCLQYRGVLPVCADARFGRVDGAVLTAALQVAHERGLTRPGDRVVVSQCPRTTQHYETMSEAGVVKILTLANDCISTRRATAVLNAAGHVVGSLDEVEDEGDLV